MNKTNRNQTSKLNQLLNILKPKIKTKQVYNYTVPDLWNAWDYDEKKITKTPWGELIVNPYHFYHEVIKSYILPKAKKNIDYSQPIHQIFPIEHSKDYSYLGGDWIKKSVVYSMMIRASTSWDHDRSGQLDHSNLYQLKETGTFIKTLVLLPLLKKMGVDVVYMLPISKFSLKDKKGELGSPYGVSNLFELDPNLKDPISGDNFTVDDEFQAFVEACHILDMKVMIDIIPRTNAVENDLILDHPEWFYWIKCEEYNDYFPPSVPSLGPILSPKPQFLEQVYQSHHVWKHIRKFSFDPKTLDSEKYELIVEEYRHNPNQSFLELIKKSYGIQIAPAFSDHINDPQPPWTDVTFFRMYLDHPVLTHKELKKHVGDEVIPPYILFDTIKNNYYQGNQPNIELWETLSNVIPYYQSKFGIDGARIDMGHALSNDLLDMILSKARQIDPNFCFIAEELESSNAQKARESGYNMIIGPGFTEEPRFQDRRLHAFLYDVHHLSCPLFACGETHDTPRLAARKGGRNAAKMLTILNMFVPNAIPFINSGQEVYELQPMNIGLDARPNERYLLDQNDPFYGKLALFDKYAFHYLNHMRWDIADNLDIVSRIRKQYIDTMVDLNNYYPIGFEHMSINCIGFGYVEPHKIDQQNNNILLIFANTDPYHDTYCQANLYQIREAAKNYTRKANQLYSQYEPARDLYDFDYNLNLNLYLKPSEVKIIKI
ncbi:alpha-amylase [Mycoplasmatota bacterium]|nr:alpha-amylase [Mycoplasmatota bacterium]